MSVVLVLYSGWTLMAAFSCSCVWQLRVRDLGDGPALVSAKTISRQRSGKTGGAAACNIVIE